MFHVYVRHCRTIGIMGNALLATASLAFVSSPALAAEKMSVGVGGYMQQWVGMSSVDDTTKKVSDGTAQQSDSEIFFKGSLEADNGLTFSVKVELEANSNKIDGAKDEKQSTGVIDESQLTVGGEFGKVTLGAEDPASTLTHQGGLDVGVSLNCGDTHKWIGSLAGCSHNGFGTYGHGHGDKNQIMYMSPRVSGVQFGLSYIPDSGQEGGNEALNDNEKDAWAVGGNYVGDFGGTNVAVSLGHYQGSQVGGEEMIFDGQNHASATPIGSLYRVRDHDDDEDAIKALADALAGDSATTGGTDTVEALRTAAKAAKDDIADHMVSKMVKADDKTFSNAALQVGVGSFSFGVVYADNSGGAYKVMAANRLLTEQEFNSIKNDADDTRYGTNVTYNATTGVIIDTDNQYDGTDDGEDNPTAESATNNDPSNDNPMIRMDKVGEDKSKNWDTWGVGVKYTEGAMAVSLSHLATEWDDGGEQEASMLSVSYTLAPGVASKTSLFTAERSFANGREVDGTAFVTGIAIGF